MVEKCMAREPLIIESLTDKPLVAKFVLGGICPSSSSLSSSSLSLSLLFFSSLLLFLLTWSRGIWKHERGIWNHKGFITGSGEPKGERGVIQSTHG